MKISLINKKPILMFIAFFCAYVTFPVFFENVLFQIKDYSQNWFSLDPSWNFAITKAYITNLVWGKDFVLTYGPLGFLATRMLLGINKYYLFSFDIFVFINIFLFFCYTLINSSSRKLVLLFIILCLLCLPKYFGAGTPILLFVLQIFWLQEFLSTQKFFTIVAAMLISLLLLFMKFNTGFISAFLLISTFTYGFITQPKIRKHILVIVLVYFFLFGVLAYILNVSVLQYFKTGFMMVEGYSDIMHLTQNKFTELFFGILLITSSILLLCFVIRKLKLQLHFGLYLVFLFAAPAYILYKQGFTRADVQHIREFYCYFPLLVLAFPQFLKHEISLVFKSIPLVMVGICLFFINQNQYNVIDNTLSRFNKSRYFKSFFTCTKFSGIFIDSSQNQLPVGVKQKISNGRIDAYPWNIIELFENNLNIASRPIIQSYTAYTPELEKLNAEFYDSEKSPEFVLYDYASIDNRYPLLDEPLLHLRLFNNYVVCDTLKSYGRFKLLLKKNTKRNIKLLEVKTYEANLNSKIIPKEDTYYEVYIKKTMKGKIQSLFFNPPQILFQVMNGNRQLFEYHTSTKLLESGFFSNKFYSNTKDVLNSYTQTTTDKQAIVLFYGFRALNTNCFSDKIIIKEYNIIK